MSALGEQIISQLEEGKNITEIVTEAQARGFSAAEIDKELKEALSIQAKPSVKKQSLKEEKIHFDLTKAFVIIGALLLVVALAIIIYSQWADVSPLTRVLFLFIPMILLFGISRGCEVRPDYHKLGRLLYHFAILFVPFTFGTILYQFDIVREPISLLITLSAFGGLMAFLLVESFIRSYALAFMAFIAFSLMWSGLMAYLFQEVLATDNFLIVPWISLLAYLVFCIYSFYSSRDIATHGIYLYFSLLASVGLLFTALMITVFDELKLGEELTPVVISIFGLAMIAIASLLNYLRRFNNNGALYLAKRLIEEVAPLLIILPLIFYFDEGKKLYSFIGISLSLVLILLSVKVWTRLWAVIGSFGLIVGLLLLTKEFFSDSVLWPVLLLVTGFASIGLGLLIRKMTKTFSANGQQMIGGVGIDRSVRLEFLHGRVWIWIIVAVLSPPVLLSIIGSIVNMIDLSRGG